MKKWLNIYFGFSTKEASGLLVLVGAIGIAMLIPYVYGLVKPHEPITEIEKAAVLKLVLTEKEKILHRENNRRRFKIPAKNKAELFNFDPNTIDQADWERLGLSPKQALVIIKYVERGGKFRAAEDLQKMYTINEELYKALAPYVKIRSVDVRGNKYEPKIYGRQISAKKNPVVEINAADTIELDKIRGIGMTFAHRIIKYRDRIGGFYKKEQLREVFGIDSVKYNEIEDQIVIDKSKLKKINVNTANFEDFRNHPYIRYKQVNALIAYRKQHGNYSNIADLNKVAILNEETINRLAAYLEF